MTGADIRPSAAVRTASIVITTRDGHSSTLPVVSASVAVRRVQDHLLRTGIGRWSEVAIYGPGGLVCRWRWEKSGAGYGWRVIP